MASNIPEHPAPNSQPPRVTPPMIIRSSYRRSDPALWKLLLPAWVASGLVHIVLVGMFVGAPYLGLSFLRASETVPTEASVIETKVEEQTKQADLENDEVGIDPEVPQTNYDVPRIDPVSIPGVVKSDEAIGIPGGTEVTPMNVPPPPGFGGGTVGGLDSDKFGKAPMIGLPGGMGVPAPDVPRRCHEDFSWPVEFSVPSAEKSS